MEEKYYELWLGNELVRFSRDEIKSDPKLEQDLKRLQVEKESNELQFFSPHGKAKMGYDCGFQLVSMTDFINDNDHTFYINCSPNRTGKTAQAVVRIVTRVIPCNPEWAIFKQNGIKYQEWTGAKIIIVLGYDRGQLSEVVWPAYQKWIPDNELGVYRPAIRGGTKEPSWDRHPRINLKCGSRLIFLTCEQRASVAAGMEADIIHSDEQQPLAFFNELDERGRTRGGITWNVSYTPHKVEGRPDTGGNSWLVDMWNGDNVRGHNILRTRTSVDDVPNHIYSADQKKAAYQKHVVQPKLIGDKMAEREGRARYYGEAQHSTGLYYPEIEPTIHFIDWTYDDIKDKGWTHYRSMDYGYASPTSCGLWAVSPTGDMFRYDEYYVAGKDAISHAPAIIEHCGNKRKLVKKYLDKESGIQYDWYEEIPVKQYYVQTILDWHCFSNKGGSGLPISFFFQIGGLHVYKSTTFKQEQRAQNLRALLRIDPERKHLVTGKKGAPRIYISRINCRKLIWEWQRCIFDPRFSGQETHNPKEGKRNKDDHAIDDSEYFACSNARYLGDYDKRMQPKEMQPLSSHGGY